MSTNNKAKAVPNPNPCGLTAREVEIAVLSWSCVDADGKASNAVTPSTPKSSHNLTHTHNHEHMSSVKGEEDHHNAPRKVNKPTDTSLAPHPKQINKQELANIARIGQAESAGRMWRGIKNKITAAASAMPSSPAAPATPATPVNPDDGSAVADADPGSPSLLASKKKKTAAAGKVNGRKRTIKEAGGGDGDGSDGAEDGERPKKVAKSAKAKSVVTLKADPDAAGTSGEMEAGEV